MSKRTVTVRDSSDADVARITEIYARSVNEEIASFELTPPDEREMARRRQALIDDRLPYLVAELDGEVVGYAYAGLFRARPAYGWTCENTVYVDPRAQRSGVASALMKALIGRCEQRGFRQMMAVISAGDDAEKSASIRFHRAMGFVEVGCNRSVGYKHGRWWHTYHLQLPLGPGDTSDPGDLPCP